MQKNTGKMKHTFRYYILSAMLVFLASCSNSDNKASRTPTATPVKVYTVEPATIAPARQFVGTVEEETGSMLSFEVAGNIEEMMVDAGDRVRAGQPIARLNTAQLQSMLDAAQATLTQARDAYTRYKQLHEKGSLPDIKWIEVESKLQQAESAVAIAQKRLNDCTLCAPYDGYIASRPAQTGMNVMPGSPVAKLVNINEVYITFAVPEKEISGMKEGQRVTFTVDAVGNGTYNTRITEKGIEANPISHTYKVKCLYANADRSLLPGMVCRASLSASDGDTQIIIPANTVKVDTDGSHFVWTVKDNQARRQTVATGNLTSRGVVITSGLAPGDMVITQGSQKVSDGMNVTWE